ncbi:T-box transcription factor TBX5-A [Frankliniella fusca]|uniref:T-box transcription factor TBX5-A n=1 Tax=Frankliniella fusca TaxID=407009 RepID=A0AAE1LU04_9NEOP|nr:T-box transcription factor TBX5-A [Frankliniella fusca]
MVLRTEPTFSFPAIILYAMDQGLRLSNGFSFFVWHSFGASAGRPYQQAAAPPPAPAPAPAPQRASPGPSLEDITAPLPPPPSWSPGLDADITDLAISLGLYSAPAPTYGYLTAAPGGAPTTPAVGTAPMDPGAEGPSALPSTGPAADAGYTIAEGPSAPPSADPAAAAALPAGPGAGRLHTPDTSSPSDAPATPRAATMGESSGLADRASVPPINFVVREVLRATAAMVAGHMAGATKTVTDSARRIEEVMADLLLLQTANTSGNNNAAARRRQARLQPSQVEVLSLSNLNANTEDSQNWTNASPSAAQCSELTQFSPARAVAVNTEEDSQNWTNVGSSTVQYSELTQFSPAGAVAEVSDINVTSQSTPKRPLTEVTNNQPEKRAAIGEPNMYTGVGIE